MFVGEIVIESQEKIASYVGPDQLHLSFNFALLYAPWDEEHMRETIDETLAALGAVGAPATWVFENHDVTRVPTRYGGGEVGQRRARAAALLLFGLPGTSFTYQGQELGLEEVDLPGRSTSGPGLPPHERRPERARRLSRADPVDEGAAGPRVHRRRALAADAPGLGCGQRRGAAGGPAGSMLELYPLGDAAAAARRQLRVA